MVKAKRGFAVLASVLLAVALSLPIATSAALPQEAQAKTTSLAAAASTTSKAKKASSSASKKPAKIVMIGDSYSTKSKARGIARPWPERVSSALGVPAGSRKVYRHSGYGFAKSGHRFISLLKKAKRNTSVTDVLIVGGAGNDRFTSNAKVNYWYRVTIKRLRYLYPRATIMHTITSWDLNSAKYRRLITARIPYYRALAKKCGVTYLYGCETVLRTHPEYFGSDGRHPNELGQRVMSKRIAAKVKKYNPRYA